MNPGSLVSILLTIDEDKGQNYSYSVTPSELFSIVQDRLETRQRFNYEERNVYFVNITSTDSGNQSLTQEVVVSILDVNDAPTGIVLPQGTAIAENTKVSHDYKMLNLTTFLHLRAKLMKSMSIYPAQQSLPFPLS